MDRFTYVQGPAAPSPQDDLEIVVHVPIETATDIVGGGAKRAPFIEAVIEGLRQAISNRAN